jgi:hypothetical protein
VISKRESTAVTPQGQPDQSRDPDTSVEPYEQLVSAYGAIAKTATTEPARESEIAEAAARLWVE